MEYSRTDVSDKALRPWSLYPLGTFILAAMFESPGRGCKSGSEIECLPRAWGLRFNSKHHKQPKIKPKPIQESMNHGCWGEAVWGETCWLTPCRFTQPHPVHSGSRRNNLSVSHRAMTTQVFRQRSLGRFVALQMATTVSYKPIHTQPQIKSKEWGKTLPDP